MLLCQEKHIDELYFLTVWSSLWQKAMLTSFILILAPVSPLIGLLAVSTFTSLSPKGEPQTRDCEYTEFDEVDVISPDTGTHGQQHATD